MVTLIIIIAVFDKNKVLKHKKSILITLIQIELSSTLITT